MTILIENSQFTYPCYDLCFKFCIQSILDLVTDLVSRKSVTKSRRVTKSMYTINPNPYRGGRTGNTMY